MTQGNENKEKNPGKPWILAFVNVFIWTVAIVALAFIVQDCPGVKGMYVILAGGTSIGIILLSMLLKYRKNR